MCDIDKYIILVYVDESVRNIVMNSVAYSDTSVLCGALSQNFHGYTSKLLLRINLFVCIECQLC